MTPSAPPRKPAQFFMWPGVCLYLGPVVDATRHRHHAAQISAGLERSFRIDFGSGTQMARFAHIPANLAHAFDGQNGLQMVLLLDAQSPAGLAVSANGTGLAQTLPPNPPPLPQDLAGARALVDWALGAVEPVMLSRSHPKPDPRIDRVLAALSDPGTGSVAADDLASLAALSKSRFLHLFKQQTGLPLRRYILWRRLLLAVGAVGSGDDLTRAAHFGGFADSAHFSRVFRENFGLKPSKILKNSQFVQVLADISP